MRKKTSGKWKPLIEPLAVAFIIRKMRQKRPLKGQRRLFDAEIESGEKPQKSRKKRIKPEQ